jgi:Holliday junction resolvase RusA-like endonuclease
VSTISFAVPAIPVAQPRQRVTTIGGHARTYMPAKHPVQAFKATTRLAYAEAAGDAEPASGPVMLTLEFLMPRPKAMCWKTKPTLRAPHTKKPDIDNLVKAVMDALTGLAWRDDTQVCFLFAAKSIAAGDESPSVKVTIRI